MTQALRRKRLDLEIETIIYHHDNAPAHQAVDTVDTIDFLGMERLPHAPYSPDLAPMDFALFPRLKSEMRGKRYDDLDDFRMEVRRLMSSYKKEWFRDVFSNAMVTNHLRAPYGVYFTKNRIVFLSFF